MSKSDSLSSEDVIKEELERRTKNCGNNWIIAHLNYIRGPEFVGHKAFGLK